MDTTPLPVIIMKCFKEYNYQVKRIKDITQFDFSDKVVSVFPHYYFSPKDNRTNKIRITPKHIQFIILKGVGLQKRKKLFRIY